jgi:hypothetical protein
MNSLQGSNILSFSFILESEESAKNKKSQQVTAGTDQKTEESQNAGAASSDNDTDNQPKDFTSLLEASLRNQLSTYINAYTNSLFKKTIIII